MEEKAQQLIREILRELNEDHKITYTEPADNGRPRFKIDACNECEKRNIYFNIPKNANLKFQLVFENGNKDRKLRDQLMEELKTQHPTFLYNKGGGDGSWGYLSIYLPNRKNIKINTINKNKIATRIKVEIERVCEAFNTIKNSALKRVDDEGQDLTP